MPYTTKGPGDLDIEPITYGEPERPAEPYCRLCGGSDPVSAIIHNKELGKIEVCSSCHDYAREHDEIGAIPTVLLEETPRPITIRSVACAYLDLVTSGRL